MIAFAEVTDPLLLAKSLLAQEIPLGIVAHQVGLPSSRIRKIATREGWLRRSRRDPYSAAVRIEALHAYEQVGSFTRAARMLGIGRNTLIRWLQNAAPTRRVLPVVWRCYFCGPEFGLRVEGSTCPGCGTIRTFTAEDAPLDEMMDRSEAAEQHHELEEIAP